MCIRDRHKAKKDDEKKAEEHKKDDEKKQDHNNEKEHEKKEAKGPEIIPFAESEYLKHTSIILKDEIEKVIFDQGIKNAAFNKINDKEDLTHMDEYDELVTFVYWSNKLTEEYSLNLTFQGLSPKFSLRVLDTLEGMPLDFFEKDFPEPKEHSGVWVNETKTIQLAPSAGHRPELYLLVKCLEEGDGMIEVNMEHLSNDSKKLERESFALWKVCKRGKRDDIILSKELDLAQEDNIFYREGKFTEQYKDGFVIEHEDTFAFFVHVYGGAQFFGRADAHSNNEEIIATIYESHVSEKTNFAEHLQPMRYDVVMTCLKNGVEGKIDIRIPMPPFDPLKLHFTKKCTANDASIFSWFDVAQVVDFPLIIGTKPDTADVVANGATVEGFQSEVDLAQFSPDGVDEKTMQSQFYISVNDTTRNFSVKDVKVDSRATIVKGHVEHLNGVIVNNKPHRFDLKYECLKYGVGTVDVMITLEPDDKVVKFAVMKYCGVPEAQGYGQHSLVYAMVILGTALTCYIAYRMCKGGKSDTVVFKGINKSNPNNNLSLGEIEERDDEDDSRDIEMEFRRSEKKKDGGPKHRRLNADDDEEEKVYQQSLGNQCFGWSQTQHNHRLCSFCIRLDNCSTCVCVPTYCVSLSLDIFSRLSFNYPSCITNLKQNSQRPCLLYTSPSPRDGLLSRMPSSA
eukprot:TRINITY_DN1010_c0_g1_i2.p1 TRINITY_DN1010_c0_g1~~TRINITY_DN1010_c0_g1_i2.p1  ORF type:complete len:680 (+),score=212.48 TRINITY_DN1010_c0_g1_i2:65-2104(+)